MTLTDEITSRARESGQETPQKLQEVRCRWCKRRFAPRRATQQYCHPSHRLAAFKYRKDPEHAPPPPRPPRSSASGPQLSYRKTQRELEQRLWQFPEVMAIVDEVLLDVMPTKQRERLEARNA